MTIRRCVPNLVSGDLGASRGFYAGLLGFEVAMDEDDLTMYRSPSNPTAQVTVGTDAESAWDPEVHRPRLSVEVEDVDAVHAEAVRRGLRIVHPLTDEPWGVRRFFVEDPDGTVVNVLSHL